MTHLSSASCSPSAAGQVRRAEGAEVGARFPRARHSHSQAVPRSQHFLQQRGGSGFTSVGHPVVNWKKPMPSFMPGNQ